MAMLKRPVPFCESAGPVVHRFPASDYESIEELVALCAQGKLYEVEHWIADGKPIQCTPVSGRKLRRRATPLEIVSFKGFYSLAELLLVNGYDPNADEGDCLSGAVAAKNRSMVDLLLRHGADPRMVDFTEVLETHDRTLMDLFVAAGVDPCEGNAVAKALRYKTRPLLGFVKSYKQRFPTLQRQIDIALHSFVDEQDEKGVCVMLWLGANPYANVPSNAWGGDEDDNDEFQWCALEAAVLGDSEAIIMHLLKVPFPPDRVQALLHSVSFRAHPEVVRRLLKAGADPNTHHNGRHILDEYVRSLSDSFFQSGRTKHIENGIEALRLLSEAGARWDIDNKGIAKIRRSMLDAESSTVNAMLQIFQSNQVLNDEQLAELTRTPAMKRLLVGSLRANPKPHWGHMPRSSFVAPSQTEASQPRRGYWKRHWSRR